MSGTWISQIQAELCKSFPASKDYRAADFKRSPMPVSVGHFLEYALSRRVATVQVSVESEWFDLADPAVVDGERQWRDALTAAARYPASMWEQSLNQAVAFVISYMVTPADTFCDFACAGNERGVHPKTILNRLAYFKPYPSLREVIRGYLERKGTEPIEPADLRAAILKADRSIVAEYEPSDWIALLAPLFEMAEMTQVGDREAQVPMSILKDLFGAKGADELVQRLEAIESIGGHRMLSEASLLKAIGPTELPRPVEEVAEAPEVDTTPRPRQRNDVHAESETSAMPRWMQFAAKVEPKPPSTESGDGGTAIVQPAPSLAGTVREPEYPSVVPSRVGERAPMPDDPIKAEPSREVKSNLNPVERRVFGDMSQAQRKQFVEYLFDGNFADFSRVVSMLDKAQDWETAAHVIGSEVFERNGVDIYSEPAIEFTNLVESRFE